MQVECIVAAYLFRATAEVMGQVVMDKPSRVYNSWVNTNEIQRTLTQSSCLSCPTLTKFTQPKHKPSLGEAKVTQWPIATSCVMIAFG